jgi:hypothetical protein
MKPKDLSSRIFGRLTVLVRHSSTRHGLKWQCRCTCGLNVVVYSSALLSGRTQSCGCLHDECSNKAKTHGHGRTGAKRSPEHRIWDAMIQRCTNPNNKHYKNYGNRGIKVCPRWRDFAQFYRDCGPRPSPKHTIERVDNDKGYAPANCKWATRKEQQNNRRNNRLLCFKGATKTLTQWAETLGMSPGAVAARIRLGWSTERALTVPVRTR